MKEFIPIADNVTILQQGRDDAGKVFQKIAEQGHYAGRTVPTDTRQGTYVATPSGKLLASVNSNDPEVILALLRRARVKWDAMNKSERMPGDAEKLRPDAKSWGERFYPADGLVLRVNTRDLPRPAGAKGRTMDAWNEDFAWFRKAEAEKLVPEEHTAGATRAVPAKIIRRIIKLHLVDDVRGETIPFEDKDISVAELTAKISEVGTDFVTIHFEGKTRAEAIGKWPVAGFKDMHKPTRQKRGFETKLLGTAKWDTKKKKFTSFELLAVGTRWGGTQYNNRSGDFDAAPIGVAFTLASEKSSDRVPPANCWSYGWW